MQTPLLLDELIRLQGSIGRTRVVDIGRVCNAGRAVFAKCEHMNPTGSHKVRAYVAMLIAAAQAGSLHGDTELVDYSTGNAGAALAWLARTLGLSCTIVMPEGLPNQRYQHLLRAGARLIKTAGPGMNTPAAKSWAIEYCARQPNRLLLDQLCNPANVLGLEALGHEIVHDARHRGFSSVLFVAGYGTGATLSAVARVLREELPGSRTVAVEVEGAGHLGAQSTHLIDEVVSIAEADAHHWTRRAHAVGGEWVGTSSGANLAAIQKLILREGHKALPIVTLFWDAGWKYADRPDGKGIGTRASSEQDVLV
jgi:cysteine synthase